MMASTTQNITAFLFSFFKWLRENFRCGWMFSPRVWGHQALLSTSHPGKPRDTTCVWSSGTPRKWSWMRKASQEKTWVTSTSKGEVGRQGPLTDSDNEAASLCHDFSISRDPWLFEAVLSCECNLHRKLQGDKGGENRKKRKTFCLWAVASNACKNW